MGTIRDLSRAITVRQAERAERGEDPIEEMWITEQMLHAFEEDARHYMVVYTGKPQPTTCMGVKLLVIERDGTQ